MLTRRHFMQMTSAAGLAATTLPAWAGELQTVGGDAFGSYWRLTVPRRFSVPRHFTQTVAMIDAVFSPYRPDSALSRFNVSRDTDWQPALPELSRLTALAVTVAHASNGAFDPTVGPLVNRYGFGPITGEMTGYAALEATSDGIRKTTPGLSIDLCGIAKGRALDLMCEALADAGIGDFLLDLGGEVAARGHNPAGRPWQIGVDVPQYPMQYALALGSGALATSGTLPNGYLVDGRLVSHIIDPVSGMPVQSAVRSVSVMAPAADLADAWATALIAMPLETALEVAETQAIDALILIEDGDMLRPLTTGTMADHLLA